MADLHSDGTWTPARGGGRREIRCPADGSLVGDVDAASVSPTAKAFSPVPGGVGPVTTALLLAHTVQAAEG